MIPDKIRMVELFAGIGATHQALTELGLNVEVLAISDIDKNAIKGYEAIHGPVNNLGDITKIDSLPACDLLTYTWPCQAVSIAGKKTGMVEGSGTSSALLWEVGRLLKEMNARGELPPVLLAENVDAVLNARNYPEFKRWIITLANLGYTTSYRILNAKNYGTPQNRRRLFVVSTLNKGALIFPRPNPDGRVLKDILEDNVNNSFFISDERLKTFIAHKERQDRLNNGFGFKITDQNKEPAHTVSTHPDRYWGTWIYDKPAKIIIAGEMGNTKFKRARPVISDKGLCPTLTCEHGNTNLKIKISEPAINWPADTKKGYMEAHAGDGLVMNRPNKARGTVQKEISPTLTTGNGGGCGTVSDNLRIRYLTPRECLRLQAFPEDAIDRISEVLTKTALYKVAGNSIPVCVLKAIFKAIYIDESFKKAPRQVSLDVFDEVGESIAGAIQ